MTRRPLLTLEGLREPTKANGLENRMRRLADKFGERRFAKASYNRRQRHLYKTRVPNCQDGRRNHRKFGAKRVAPEKRFGAGRLRKR